MSGAKPMILATDVHYTGKTALAAGVLFEDWQSSAIKRTVTAPIYTVAPYAPGNFYKRELPCLLTLLQAVPEALHCIVVDGYVTLGTENTPGLGLHLYNAIGQATPVIGVAKRPFHNTPAECAILRSGSQSPLYVTAAGVPLDAAKRYITEMHGEFRIPTILKQVDQLCRGII